jgi:hypothetical protein
VTPFLSSSSGGQYLIIVDYNQPHSIKPSRPDLARPTGCAAATDRLVRPMAKQVRRSSCGDTLGLRAHLAAAGNQPLKRATRYRLNNWSKEFAMIINDVPKIETINQVDLEK